MDLAINARLRKPLLEKYLELLRERVVVFTKKKILEGALPSDAEENMDEWLDANSLMVAWKQEEKAEASAEEEEVMEEEVDEDRESYPTTTNTTASSSTTNQPSSTSSPGQSSGYERSGSIARPLESNKVIMEPVSKVVRDVLSPSPSLPPPMPSNSSTASNVEVPKPKKQRFLWEDRYHNEFIDAIIQLGIQGT